MRIEIRSREVEVDTTLHELIERRLHFALHRFAESVRHVTVRLRDENGPRGGIDKTCSVLLVAEPDVTVMIQDTDASVEAAIGRAVERAARTLARALGRARAVA